MRYFRLVLAEFRRLASLVGDIAGDLLTAYTDYHDERLFRPLRIILIPLSELPLVRPSMDNLFVPRDLRLLL